MPLLAIDTAIDIASITLKVKGKVWTREKQGATTHAQSILVMVNELLEQAEINVSSLSGLVVGRGPGSFTGIRVATSVVKGLSYPWQIPVFAISDLASIAWQAHKQYPKASILALMDARMNQVYWSHYAPGCFEAEEKVDSVASILPMIQQTDVIAGYQFEQYFNQDMGSFTCLAVRPDSLGMIEMVETGIIKPIKALELEPVYVRDQITQGTKNG